MQRHGAGLTIEKKGESATTIPLPMQGDGYAAEHDAFFQAIRSGAEPPHSLAAIAPSLFLAELIENGFSGRVQLPQTRFGLLRRGGRPRENPFWWCRPPNYKHRSRVCCRSTGW
jgi:hypothetical protein